MEIPEAIGDHPRIKMRLLGIIHGDGNMTNGRLLITDMSKDYHENVIMPMFTEAFGIRLNLFHDVGRNSYYSHTKRKVVYEFFANNLEVPRGAVRQQLFIPRFLSEANKTLQREYVGGLYDAEGCVKTRQAELNFSTTSKEIFEFVKTVLKDASIDFSIYIRHRHEKPEYEIYIYGKDRLRKFNRLIKFKHPEKIKKLKMHI